MERPNVNVNISGGQQDPLNPIKNLAELTQEVTDIEESIDRHGNTRPVLAADNVGYMMFDEILGKPIWWNGTAWVDANGNDPDATV